MPNQTNYYQNYVFLSELFKSDNAIQLEVKNNKDGTLYYSSINQSDLTI